MSKAYPILEQIKSELGFDQIGISDIKIPITIDFYEKWLMDKTHGTMDYLNTHFEIKKNPRLISSELKSVISITQSYFPIQKEISVKVPARIAMYSQNQDYHYWLKDKLNLSIKKLKLQYPEHTFLPYTDSGPILEKDWAYQAGLGWFGKNSCLIHPKKGSLFFVAEILTTLNIDTLVNTTIDLNNKPTVTSTLNFTPSSNSTASTTLVTSGYSKVNSSLNDSESFMHDFCGTCTRCIDACPTQAIVEPKKVQADRCISYLTIESKTAPPLELRSKINDWFFGCDICQTVCPWNLKLHPGLERAQTLTLKEDQRSELINFFKGILQSSNKSLQKQFYGTALFRAAGFGLKRNALVVITNQKFTELKPEVSLLIKDSKLSELAEWCLIQLDKV